MTEQIVPVEAQRAIKETEIMVKTYDNYIVVSQDNYASAGRDLLLVKTKIKELDELRKSLTRPLDESKKRIMEFFNKPLDFLERTKTAIDEAAKKWLTEQERIRQAEENRLAEIQRKAAAELERKAKETEDKAATFKTAKAREAAEAKAAELREQAAETVSIAPVVESKVDAVVGMSTRKVWKFKIVDVNKIPREYLIPDEKLIGKMGEVTKGTRKIDGIEFYSEDIIVSRRQ